MTAQRKRRPTCVECTTKPAKPLRSKLSDPYFCSFRCATAYALDTVWSRNEWCANHGAWFNPDDGCYDCESQPKGEK